MKWEYIMLAEMFVQFFCEVLCKSLNEHFYQLYIYIYVNKCTYITHIYAHMYFIFNLWMHQAQYNY